MDIVEPLLAMHGQVVLRPQAVSSKIKIRSKKTSHLNYVSHLYLLRLVLVGKTHAPTQTHTCLSLTHKENGTDQPVKSPGTQTRT